MKQKAVVISGIAGQIGSNFGRWVSLNHPEYMVVGIDDLSGGYLDNVPFYFDFYLRDVNAPLDDIFEKYDVEYFYHMAAFAAEGLSPFIRKFNYTNNLLTTANVVNHCIKYKCKLIYLSSMSVYGYGQPPYKETDECRPIDPYGCAKYCGELDIRGAGLQHGLKYTILRPHNVIGRNVNIWDRHRNVIGIWMRQLINNQPITIYGDGNQTRAFSWVEDYCEPFWKAATDEFPVDTFNIGGDNHFTLNEVAELLFKISNNPPWISYLEPRHEVRDAYCNHDRAKELLGFVDKTPLEEMLRQMWEWAITQPNRPVKEFGEFEIEDGLYSFWKKKVKILAPTD